MSWSGEPGPRSPPRRLLQLGDVGLRDDPARKDEHVTGVLLAEGIDDPREEGHVGTGQDGEPHRVGVLLNDGRRDLLRRLVQTGVDDFEARFPQGPGDHPGPTVVTVETRFRHHHPVDTLHHADTRRSDSGQASPVPMSSPRRLEPWPGPLRPFDRSQRQSQVLLPHRRKSNPGLGPVPFPLNLDNHALPPLGVDDIFSRPQPE